VNQSLTKSSLTSVASMGEMDRDAPSWLIGISIQLFILYLSECLNNHQSRWGISIHLAHAWCPIPWHYKTKTPSLIQALANDFLLKNSIETRKLMEMKDK